MNQWVETFLGGVVRIFQIGLDRRFNDIAGGIVLAILLLRVMLKRAPKVCSYLLWALVLYRLLCPFTFVSDFSFLGVFGETDDGKIQMVETNFPTAVQQENGASEPQNLQADEQFDAAQREERVSGVSRLWLATCVWAAGIAAMLLYGVVSLVLLSRRLKGAVRLRENIYLSDYVPTPFVSGVIRPRIYLPSSLQEKEMVSSLELGSLLSVRKGYGDVLR